MFVVAAALGLVAHSSAEDFDLVINNGREMHPETMYDSVVTVGIKAGRIAAITRGRSSGRETIDATGLVVIPEFIDTLFHSIDPYFTELAVRDGITTRTALPLNHIVVE